MTSFLHQPAWGHETTSFMDLLWRTFEIISDMTRHVIKATDSGLIWLPNKRDSQHVGHLKEGDSSLARSNLDSAEQHFAENTRTNMIQDHHHPHKPCYATDPGMISAVEVEERQLTNKKYTDHLKEGDSSLARADLDSAEQHFAAALKTVHERDPTAQQYQREVEPLCKLGDVYSKRGQQTGDGGDFVKAAALYNAAIPRSEDQVLNGNIEIAVKEVEKLFLKCILDKHSNVSQDDTEKHKKQLKEMRDQIKLEMETIDQQLDPYVHDEDDPCVREIEAKRAQAVRQLFDKIAQQRKEFISLLVEECIGLMGPPPCKYALIGLGSQATGLVTPYSDLEFVILVEEESEECLVYYRNLTHYLHLKVVNLGETILPALAIKSLNDYSKDDSDPLNWYYDSVTPRGFAFDGSMPKASKTPLGRQGTKNEPPSELICTPQNMVSKLHKDTLYLEEGYHLATILKNPILIAGDQDLFNTYKRITGELLQADGGKMAQQLAEKTLRETIEKFTDDKTITASLIDVKKKLYRFPTEAVDYLALSSCIEPKTVWETIEDMENQQVISPNNAHHLTVLTSISAELRLRTYMANGGQKENMSAMASMETKQHGQESLLHDTNNEAQTKILKPVFHLPNEKPLLRYHSTSIPLKSYLHDLNVKSEKFCPNSCPDFYDNSPKVGGDMYFALCHYRQAIDYYDKALEQFNPEDTDPKKIDLLSSLRAAWLGLGNYDKAISYAKQALKMHRDRHINDQSEDSGITALSLINDLASVWVRFGDYSKAINNLKDAIEEWKCANGSLLKAHPEIARSYSLLGLALREGTTCSNQKREAVSYHEQALEMYRSLHREDAVHLDIATSLNDLGGAWHQLGDNRKAINYLEQGLQMYRSIYGQNTVHPDIASSFNNLGVSWSHLGDEVDYRKAISYFQQALQMYRSIYGQSTAHPNIAISLNNLGSAWNNLGEHRRAINYLEQALQMLRGIYGQDAVNIYLAMVLDNLGTASQNLGHLTEANSYHEEAERMFRIINGARPHMGLSLFDHRMFVPHMTKGDYKKATSYLEQKLQMKFRSTCMCDHSLTHSAPHAPQNWGRSASAYGSPGLPVSCCFPGGGDWSTSNPDLAKSLSNLGSAWDFLGDYRKAVSYGEDAVQTYKTAYGHNKAHPDIAMSFSNLGLAWSHLGDYRKAISYHEQALQMYRSIYGQSAANAVIAMSLNNLGSTWGNLGDHGKAVSYHEQALQMRRSIYGQGTAHPDIAGSLNNLGTAWFHLHDNANFKAISYLEQALQMYKSAYGQSTENPDIASSLNNLGLAWHHLCDDTKAISCLEQALQMYGRIYGQGTARPEIAAALYILGAAWDRMGQPEKASICYKLALQMYRTIHGQDTALPHIAKLLRKLWLALVSLGQHEKASSYFEQLRQVRRNIHGQNSSNPALSLKKLGMDWYV